MEWLFIAIPVALLVILISIGYVKAPPDTAYIISGFRKPRILIGKAGIRIPFLERMDRLSLKMFSVDVKTTDYVPNAEYINVKVDATVKIRIGQTPEMMTLASKFFLNESEAMIISSLSFRKNLEARVIISSFWPMRILTVASTLTLMYSALGTKSVVFTSTENIFRESLSSRSRKGMRMPALPMRIRGLRKPEMM